METTSAHGDDDIHSIGLQDPVTQSAPYEELHGQSVTEHVPGTYEPLSHVGPDYANLPGPTRLGSISSVEGK